MGLGNIRTHAQHCIGVAQYIQLAFESAGFFGTLLSTAVGQPSSVLVTMPLLKPSPKSSLNMASVSTGKRVDAIAASPACSLPASGLSLSATAPRASSQVAGSSLRSCASAAW